MSNMTESQRDQMGRPDLGYTRTRLNQATPGQQRVWSVLTVVFIGVLVALSYAAVQVFDGWAHLVVIADLIIVFFAVAIWLNRGKTA
jgi:hypothetical protein